MDTLLLYICSNEIVLVVQIVKNSVYNTISVCEKNTYMV